MANRGRTSRLRRRALLFLALGAATAGALTGAAIVAGTGVTVVSPFVEGTLAYAHHGSAAAVKRSIAQDKVTVRCAALAFRGIRGSGCGRLRDYPGARRAGVQRAADVSSTAGAFGGAFQYPPAGLLQGGGGTGNPAIAINQIVLPTGKVLFFSYPFTRYDVATNMAAYAWLWDPSLGTGPAAFREVDPPTNPSTNRPFNIWCGAQTVLPDGRVVVVGGTKQYEYRDAGGVHNHLGLNVIMTFNPFSETWALQHDLMGNSELMSHGRWYPSLVALPDGRVVIVSGREDINNGATDGDVEVFTPSPDMNGTNGTVTLKPSAFRVTNLYPHLFVLPDTTAAGAGGTAQAPKILLAGPGLTANPKPDSAILDTATWTWTEVPGLDRNRDYGTAVLMPGGPSGSTSVRLLGGNSTSVASSIALDLSSPLAGWKPAAPMNVPRSHLNTVILPDGSLFTVGGGKGVVSVPNYEDKNSPYPGNIGDNYETTANDKPPSNPPLEWTSELWSPATDSWSLAATQHDFRTYHSTAVLLPDGTVLSAGDDRPSHQGLAARTGEIYYPPYLFRGPRPTITNAPVAVGYGQSFGVGTPDQVSGAVLVAPAAVTHANDMDQRSLKLTATPTAGGVVLSTPADQTVLPPRYYMLFLLNAQGVPSVATWVKVDPSQAAPVYPAPGASGAGAGASAAGPAGPGGAAAAGSAVARKATLPPVRVSIAKVKLVRRGPKLVASFVLRGKAAFRARIRLGRLGAKGRLIPPIAARSVRAAGAKKAKALPVTLSVRAPKGGGKVKLGLRVALSASGARPTSLSRTLVAPAVR